MPKRAAGKAPTPTPMTTTAASRIQSSQAKSGSDTSRASFPARAQSAAATNANKGVTVGSPPKPTAAATSGAAKPPSGGAKSPASGKAVKK
ncbi:hypothetical protein GGX14DRAFT_162941 [Mycena pura]|uniref:Uncharacterized protein n=1 Tax=Mycena pura TaxID=153505 RepID=A0AAD7E0U2_9AGAR|nr:hypothetical protein GGX14DRAFT_162941 [Mycena pura]